MKENDVFALRKPVEATVIGEHDVVFLQVGTVASVTLVFGDADVPTAYEVEAFLDDSGKYALATVEACDIL